MNGGVIIIGSLFWQQHRSDKNKDFIRRDWRTSNLDMDKAIRVRLPIKYGRKSSGDIYTMVFSASLERSNNLGVGYIVPCLNNPISNFEDIAAEAIAFAKAEGLGTFDKPRFYDSWGSSLGILFNRIDSTLSEEYQEKIMQEWTNRFESDGGGKDLHEYKVGNERRSIDNYGRLSINWPIPLDKRDKPMIDKLDFLIAASNKPRYNEGVYKYPRIVDLIRSVGNDRERYYFINNLKNGIFTYQDSRILKGLNEKTSKKR